MLRWLLNNFICLEYQTKGKELLLRESVVFFKNVISRHSDRSRTEKTGFGQNHTEKYIILNSRKRSAKKESCSAPNYVVPPKSINCVF